MKSTDIARRDRELRREKKRNEVMARRAAKRSRTVGDYINDLHALFFHDDNRIYNTVDNNEQVMELLETMKMELPEKQWDNVLRKAVKKTQVKERERAIKELKEVLDLV